MAQRTAAAFGQFPRTQSIWTFVRQLQDDGAGERALEELLRRYRPPLKAHLVCKRKLPSDDADDLLQDFIANKILRLKLMEQADLTKGRFRSFLLTALDRYLIDHSRKRVDPTVSLDGVQDFVPAQEEADDDSAFDIAWASEVIAAATARMKQECDDAGRPEVWGIFEDRFLNPILKQTEPASYGDLVTRYALKSPAQASNLLITAKRMFQRAMEAVVSEYEPGDAEIRQELEALKAAMARVGAG